jgi:hypothetical protein
MPPEDDRRHPWSPYRVGSKIGASDCRPVETVAHTTHLGQAVEIVRTGTVTAGLVFDKSKLKNSRVRVVWLSPNHWHNGFRYGSVQFHFSLAEIVDDMNAFYVETAEYPTHAPRILISGRERDKLVTRYRPHRRHGPWWHDKDGGKHYYNGDYTLELLVESDLHLIHASKITFVKHHDDMCSLKPTDPSSCKECGWEGNQAGAYFLARLVGEKLASKAADLLVDEEAPRMIFEALGTRSTAA